MSPPRSGRRSSKTPHPVSRHIWWRRQPHHPNISQGRELAKSHWHLQLHLCPRNTTHHKPCPHWRIQSKILPQQKYLLPVQQHPTWNTPSHSSPVPPLQQLQPCGIHPQQDSRLLTEQPASLLFHGQHRVIPSAFPFSYSIGATSSFSQY